MYSLLLCINVYTGKTFAAQGCFPFVRWKSPVFLKIFFIRKSGRQDSYLFFREKKG